MAETLDETIRSINDIHTDIPAGSVNYPGNPITIPSGFSATTRILEQPIQGGVSNLAGEAGLKPVASITYPDKSIHVMPISNTNIRDVKPVGLSGSVTLPIRGERVFDLGEGLRQPLESRLTRLLESTTSRSGAMPSEAMMATGASKEAAQSAGQVKTELEKIKEMARAELQKRSSAKQIPALAQTIYPKTPDQPRSVSGSVSIITSPIENEQPIAPETDSNLVGQGQQILPTAPQSQTAGVPMTQGPAGNQMQPSSVTTTGPDISTSNLLNQAQVLEQELQKLERDLSGKSPLESAPKSIPEISTRPPEIGQVGDIAEEKMKLLNQINGLAASLSNERSQRQALEENQQNLETTYRQQIAAFQSQNQELERNLQNLRQQQMYKEDQTAGAQQLQNEVGSLRTTLQSSEQQRGALQSKVQSLENFIAQLGKTAREAVPILPTAQLPLATPVREERPEVKVVRPEPAIGRMAPSLTTAPNVISGVVKDENGMLLPSVVLVVKNEIGDPVRALKTNKIGQFAISTPLPNGTYNMELESPGKNFDIIQVHIKGQVMPPIEIRSHN